MKRIRIITALIMVVLTITVLTGCGGRETGPKLEHNVARLYSPSERSSRFAIDGELVEGSVKGTAYMETSARGDTSLAWVDGSVLYFVSRHGIKQLGSGISAAELSFDGNTVMYVKGNDLYKYSAEDGTVHALDYGISSLIQFAVSPGGQSIAYTAMYEGAEDEPIVKLVKDGEKKTLFEGGAVAVLAVSDDANLIWFFDSSNSTFGYEKEGERKVVSTECGADANYNFTNDLKEVAFNTSDGINHLYRMESDSETKLGEGFDFTLKTDVFSISTVTFFVYINDVDTFTNGLWQKRLKTRDSYIYSAGFIDSAGEIAWLAENASSCEALPDGSRVIWVCGGQLYSTDMNGKNVQLATAVEEFVIASDGYVYFLSGGVLYSVKGEGRPARIDTNVADIAVIGSRCVYLRSDGLLFSAAGVQPMDITDRVSAIDGRAGQLIVYSEPEEAGEDTVYKVLLTTDGVHFEQAAEGIKHKYNG